MSVLALDQRPGRISRQILLAVVVVIVHRAVDIGIAGLLKILAVDGLLIVHGTRGVVGLDPLVAGYEVVSEAGLVAQAPDDDAGVVEVPLHHSLIPLEVGLSVSGILGQGLLTVTHAVGLYIGLVYHI